MNSFASVAKRAFLSALIFFTAVGAGWAQTPPIRILPMGDSITFGSGGTANLGGYRSKLYASLTTAGFNVDYIGSLTTNSSGIPDQDHEGHGGWRIDQLDSNVNGWFASFADPDVILLHIGTNDFGQNLDTPNAINRIDALILKMATLRPYAHIVVTNLMVRGEPQNTNIQAQFNPFIQARVDAHAAAGRRVYFLDMRSAVPLSDMPDNLHPNQTGYDKMADAWVPAIQAIISPLGDAFAPGIYRAVGNGDLTRAAITFSKPIADGAAVAGNFSIGGLTVTGATLDATKRVVTLTTSPQTRGVNYTVTVNGVVDRTAGANALAANSTVSFFGATQRGYLNNVAESGGYTLVQSLDVPTIANYGAVGPVYSVDNRAFVGPFSRVAYYVELQTAAGELQYVWASMNAFTADVNKLAVPTLGSAATFQTSVSAMNVVSNVAGVSTGSGLAGNLEFWPGNYSAVNGAGVAGASDTTFDFGDTLSAGSYGSMQLHNAAAAQTLFAFNNWGGTATATNTDLGIGNAAGANPDWTFTNSAGNYTIKTIQVLVQTSGDTTAPTMATATASFGRSKITVTFSEPVSAASVSAANFSLSNGVLVLGATLSATQRDVILATTLQPPATTLTLTASQVRDTSPNANRMTAGSISVSPAALPAEVVANIGAASNGYELVYSIDLPTTGNLNALGAAAYRVDDSAVPGTFTRVAYYLELQTGSNPVQYVWAAMDAFTASRAKTGVPTLASAEIYQRNVTNLAVQSNVAGVVNGTTATGGNIEFWPNSYSVANGAAVPGASATTYDFGDTRTTTATTGYGCMQVHNNSAAQTVFAFNRFGQDGQVIDVGIGNNPAPVSNGVDWTFASNAPNFSRRVLHVMVLPGVTTAPAVVTNVPEAANYQLAYSINLPATGNLVSGAGFTNYTVNNGTELSAFSRVAYYMELQKTGDAAPRFVWTSMDAFTTNPARIGIPTPASGAVFQQNVANMNVVSNVAGVVNGTGIATGNIEFWPTNYTQANALNVPGASPTLFDFGDTRSTTGTHGSMQIHNYGATQTLFAVNNWGAAANSANALTMGIGNNPTAGQNPDYTLSTTQIGGSWDIRRVLHVYVLPGTADLAGPVITRAVGSTTLNRLVVTFDEPIADTSAVPANFSIAGLTVTGATLLPGNREVALNTSAQTPSTVYNVNATGIRDRSAAGNIILPGATANFTAYTTPAVVAGVADAAGYDLIYRLAIPSATPQWNLNTIPYNVDEAKYGERQFDRVAYLMELDGNWVYASFDRHTSQLAKIGVPTLGVSATPFQQIVGNMNVASNVAGIITGNGIATGNIEFFGGDYSAPNALSIPNGSATLYDFGDTMSAAGGHGSFQVHNYGASQTLFAYNNWGGTAGQISALGIGNNPNAGAAGQSGTQAPDWTFSASASAYTVRNLYVLARPGGTPTGTAPVVFSHPTSRLVNPGSATTFAVQASGASSFQWRKNGAPIIGQTQPWLDLTGITAGDAASYDVVVTGPSLVTSTSLAATLTLNTAPTFAGYTIFAQRNVAADTAASAILARALDAEGHGVSLNAVSAASTSGGTVSLGAGNVHYVPPTGFLGNDTFTITLTDSMGLSGTGTVNVFVSADGQPPVSASVNFQQNGSIAGLFIGVVGQTYEVQRSTDLVAWTVLKTVLPAADGTIPLTDPAPPSAKAFYRIKETP